MNTALGRLDVATTKCSCPLLYLSGCWCPGLEPREGHEDGDCSAAAEELPRVEIGLADLETFVGLAASWFSPELDSAEVVQMAPAAVSDRVAQ